MYEKEDEEARGESEDTVADLGREAAGCGGRERSGVLHLKTT